MDDEDYVSINETEIYEIIINVCINSFHAMENVGGTIRVGLGRVYPSPHVDLPFKEFCRIKIEDNRIGIPSDILQPKIIKEQALDCLWFTE